MGSATFLNGRVTLHAGDCLAVLPTLDENSIDSCVCDPPYHLASIVKRFGKPDSAEAQFGKDGAYRRASAGFMGKVWDGGDIAFRPETWAAVLRVLKPGAHLVAFAAPKNAHRMVCAIEDGGFEIRDTIAWLFGAGFPKSHNLDNQRGRLTCGCEALSERDLRRMREADLSQAVNASDQRSEILQQGLPEHSLPRAVSRAEPEEGCAGGTQRGMEGRGDLSEAPRKLRVGEVRPMSATSAVDGADGRLCDGASAGDGGVGRASASQNGVRSSRRSRASKQSARQSGTLAGQSESQDGGAWPLCDRCGKPIIPRGLGTALKPAYEPIVLARKPLIGTVAANVLKHGVGAINVDGCRVGVPIEAELGGLHRGSGCTVGSFTGTHDIDLIPKARWPANVIHDGSDEVVEAFPETHSAGAARDEPFNGNHSGGNGWGNIGVGRRGARIGDESGSAARFFYTAKADSDDRLGSKHPTVKPLDLMQYLVRLVTPPKGTILDPFAGTGTTGEAAWREGFNAILIEREPEYLADIERRMSLCLAGPDERARESIKARQAGKPQDHGPLFGEAVA